MFFMETDFENSIAKTDNLFFREQAIFWCFEADTRFEGLSYHSRQLLFDSNSCKKPHCRRCYPLNESTKNIFLKKEKNADLNFVLDLKPFVPINVCFSR